MRATRAGRGARKMPDVAVVIGDGPDDLWLEAARVCPSVAIVIFDDGGRQVYP